MDEQTLDRVLSDDKTLCPIRLMLGFSLGSSINGRDNGSWDIFVRDHGSLVPLDDLSFLGHTHLRLSSLQNHLQHEPGASHPSFGSIYTQAMPLMKVIQVPSCEARRSGEEWWAIRKCLTKRGHCSLLAKRLWHRSHLKWRRALEAGVTASDILYVR